jgi:hypothetical protein
MILLFKKYLQNFLGIVLLQDEIDKLNAENMLLQAKITENQAAISLISVLNAKVIRETIKYVDEIALSLKKRDSFAVKKKNEDLVN